jgi:hypothetical protein
LRQVDIRRRQRSSSVEPVGSDSTLPLIRDVFRQRAPGYYISRPAAIINMYRQFMFAKEIPE